MASRSPRIRMPRISLPGRARRGARADMAAPAGKPKAGETGSEAATKEATEPKPATAKPAAAKPAAKTPDPNLQERMEGLQGWMAELERRQGRLAYFGGAAVVIAVLAAGAALYFGLTAKSDSASKSDVDDLSAKVSSLESAVSKNSQDTQATLNDTVNRLQASITALQKQRAQDAANIATLQQQVTALQKAPPAATPGATAGTTTPAPGTAKKP
jgi:uncharacterized protein HemX